MDTLDNRKVFVATTDVITPQTEFRVAGEGTPKALTGTSSWIPLRNYKLRLTGLEVTSLSSSISCRVSKPECVAEAVKTPIGAAAAHMNKTSVGNLIEATSRNILEILV